MFSSRNLTLIVLLFLMLAGGLAIWNAERKAPKVQAPVEQSEDNQSTMVGRNASFIVTEGEVKKWRLIAHKAVYNESRSEAQLSEVKGEFYDKQGKPVLSFTAPKGHYTNQNNAVELSGGVLAQSTQQLGQGGKGGTLKAPTMVWSAKTDQVVASGGVALTFPEGSSTAQTCKFTLDFSHMVLQGNVASTIMSP